MVIICVNDKWPHPQTMYLTIRLLHGELDRRAGALDEVDNVAVVYLRHILPVHCQELVIDIELVAEFCRAVLDETTCEEMCVCVCVCVCV